MDENQEIEILLGSWDEFPSALERLANLQAEKEKTNGRSLERPLFRGLGNAEWKLHTTLDRHLSETGRAETLLGYYEKIARSKPVVESLTNRNWDQIPEWPDFEKLLQDEATNWIDRTLSRNSPIYQYLVYLRHHGFPSPILDWTASPFVAAMFAFDGMDKSAANVSIYVYIKDTRQGFGNGAHLFIVGTHLRTHPRHYLQQSNYSMCLRMQLERRGDRSHVDYLFLPHHEVLHTSLNRDLLVKIVIPGSEHKNALAQLDSMNLNPYTLYGSEESLMKTIARRLMLFNL